MIFNLIGEIKTISTIPYGICVRIRETQIGTKSKNGHEIGTYDYTWNCITNSDALQKYIKNYFRVGAIVIVLGQVEQSIGKDEKMANSQYNIFKIKTIDLFNMGDPKKRKIRERYNSKVVGSEEPNINDNFNNDF